MIRQAWLLPDPIPPQTPRTRRVVVGSDDNDDDDDDDDDDDNDDMEWTTVVFLCKGDIHALEVEKNAAPRRKARTVVIVICVVLRSRTGI
jgi:hypothetical protein